jgi:hypothetical protein
VEKIDIPILLVYESVFGVASMGTIGMHSLMRLENESKFLAMDRLNGSSNMRIDRLAHIFFIDSPGEFYVNGIVSRDPIKFFV